MIGLLLLFLATEPQRYRAVDTGDMDALAKRLLTHVADLRVVPQKRKDQLEDERSGYGVVLESKRIATLPHLVENAQRIEVRGPTGTFLVARVVLLDPERRVALLETGAPLGQLGLAPALPALAKTRAVNMDLFALVATTPGAGVVHGVLTHLGTEPEHEGNLRGDLALERAMPAFDDRARFVGYGRRVAFDTDRFLLVPPELINDAKTATASAPRPGASAPPQPRPWWAR